jgi:hypothetical protein
MYTGAVQPQSESLACKAVALARLFFALSAKVVENGYLGNQYR